MSTENQVPQEASHNNDGERMNSVTRWDEDNVFVYFANGLGQNKTLKATVHYMMQHDDHPYQKEVSIDGPGHVSIHLNYISKVVMGDETAMVELASGAFDGQPSTAYFTTLKSGHSPGGPEYTLEWRSGGTFRSESDYLPSTSVSSGIVKRQAQPEGKQINASDRRGEKDVWVRFKNAPHQAALSITVYFYIWGEDTGRYKTLTLKPGQDESVELNYISKVVVGQKTAVLKLSSSAFEGQPKVAYFTTFAFRHGTKTETMYNIEWSSDNKFRKGWEYN
ncbi:hypothetical protein MAJ_08390, partial [Metarhizium majus ARSEF 297]